MIQYMPDIFKHTNSPTGQVSTLIDVIIITSIYFDFLFIISFRQTKEKPAQ